MAVTAYLYGLLFTALWAGEIDFESNTIKVMLCTSSYTPDQDTHDYKDDVDNEVAGTGYVAGGATLAGKSVTYTAGTNKHTLDATDTQWASSTITARRAVVYNDTPVGDAAKPLICYQDFGEDKSSSGGNFDIIWNAAGIVEITVG